MHEDFVSSIDTLVNKTDKMGQEGARRDQEKKRRGDGRGMDDEQTRKFKLCLLLNFPHP